MDKMATMAIEEWPQKLSILMLIKNRIEYQPSGAVGTRSPPATLYRLQNPKWPPVGPKIADGVSP